MVVGGDKAGCDWFGVSGVVLGRMRTSREHRAAPVKTSVASVRTALHGVVASPEATVAIFALLLNFPWEILQAPLYAGMSSSPHATVTKACLQATVGDMVIMLMAHGAVAISSRNRRWTLSANRAQFILFIAFGLSITLLVEWLATRGYWLASWSYSPTMPLLPGTGIGLSPVLQWLILPPLTVWFARRQLVGSAKVASFMRRS